MEDRALIARVLAGNSRAADLLVNRFARFVWAILVRQLALPHDLAEDLFQEVFVRLWEDDYRRLRLWSAEGDFASYLAPIVRNLALDRLRANPDRHERPIESQDEWSDMDGEADAEELAWIHEQREILCRAVGGLSERDCELFRRRYEQEQSYREIARAMNMTVNHVGVALARLTERLKGLASTAAAAHLGPRPDPGRAVRCRSTRSSAE
jgi:RNA polymerase sigma factor (sigma-70 family)